MNEKIVESKEICPRCEGNKVLEKHEFIEGEEVIDYRCFDCNYDWLLRLVDKTN